MLCTVNCRPPCHPDVLFRSLESSDKSSVMVVLPAFGIRLKKTKLDDADMCRAASSDARSTLGSECCALEPTKAAHSVTSTIRRMASGGWFKQQRLGVACVKPKEPFCDTPSLCFRQWALELFAALEHSILLSFVGKKSCSSLWG